ncbi:hypothetical protein D3C79_942510 [compost metagenome]
MLRITHFRGSAGNHGFRVDQLGWAVGCATNFAVIAILIRRFTFRAGALHKTIRQEHAFLGIVKLRNGASLDMTVLFQAAIDHT